MDLRPASARMSRSFVSSIRYSLLFGLSSSESTVSGLLSPKSLGQVYSREKQWRKRKSSIFSKCTLSSDSIFVPCICSTLFWSFCNSILAVARSLGNEELSDYSSGIGWFMAAGTLRRFPKPGA